ncbi:23S rRNA (cytidine(2498)-2'-O)-methyltransferase RlmM [Marinobacter sp. M216]|uniref:Ribosomal RNA large subunit methyltransferase M n=1 Tax=Marinobacter albus TaxID=3030833 RepID=A0ABT7HAZ9_9GAMM|nr:MULTISPECIES: 23S rRNA (cytidine(2498)-2'-O)-methyltransferase RlmM [unclassified Marinobacter]MBW7470184.1 23S rRNA (cytidine(2498)-2'-O)-methyltransferase RlmM [Marinobacter sp. F4218]MDK9557552.1 23S rRNA (cytidine(2498)-2'-O)-methyltransferase RlmM [Marinobacter sp. M216]
MEQVLAFCRPGFEAEAGRELTDQAAERGFFGFFEPEKGAGLVWYSLGGPETAEELLSRLDLADLVFVRDWFVVLGRMPLPEHDRVGAVIEGLRNLERSYPGCARLEVRLPENNADGDLGNFSRKWVSPLSRGLRGAGLLKADQNASAPARLEVLLLAFSEAVIGFSLQENRARYVGGIPRLRLPASAPSRSALKLEEAWKIFLPPEQELDYLGGGKKAADLGAAPGGWTWQLVRQGMLVTAVDNGPMNPDLMATGQVEHVEADGYSWRPKRRIDWMVCDIVDQPRKTARLAVDWIAGGFCRYTVFNLKLPMKKRYDEWLICRDIIEKGLAEAGVGFNLKARHLYHDREEITCFIERTG